LPTKPWLLPCPSCLKLIVQKTVIGQHIVYLFNDKNAAVAYILKRTFMHACVGFCVLKFELDQTFEFNFFVSKAIEFPTKAPDNSD
jgi:deoxycytidylate deaminase